MNDKAIAPALHPICSIRPFLGLKVHSFTQNMRPFQCSHSHEILFFLSYYIHCHVFQLVCQYDDIPFASLIYCKRTFFPMCTRKIRFYASVNTGWTTKPLLPLYIRYVQSDHSLTQNMRPFLYIFVMFLSWPFRVNTLVYFYLAVCTSVFIP
jgi:hypothetical protein